MQGRLGWIALSVLSASGQMMIGSAQAQTALPGITVETAQPRRAAPARPAPARSTPARTRPAPAPAPVAQPAPAPAEPAEPIEASAPVDADPTTAVDGYVAETSPTGTKTNTPLREIPQSVSVVTRDQIDDRGAQTLNEAIGYSAGVAISPYGLDDRFDQFIIRGFEQNTTGVYRDGLRLPTFNFTGFRIEPYGVDHIDIMRGPTSTLYGLNNPGGMVNVVSKMPTEEAFGEIWASYGTWEAKTVGFDVGGPAANGKVQYRVTGLLREADTQVDFVENDRMYIAPALTLKPTDATTITILGNYQKDNLGDTFQLLPADKVRDGSIDRGTFYGEPEWSKLKGEQWGVGYQLEHKFDPAVTFRQNLRYDHASTDYHTIYPQASGFDFTALPAPTFPVVPDSVLLAAQDADETVSLFQVDNTIQLDSKYERVENKLIFGFDYTRFVGDGTLGYGLVVEPGVFQGTPPFQSTTNPTYGSFGFIGAGNLAGYLGQAVVPGDDVPTILDRKVTQETMGIYVQDQLKLDRQWVFTVGGRYDWVDSELNNRLTSVVAETDEEAFTYRVGLNYLFDNGLTPYVSYSTSFFPVPLTTSNGAPLKPEEGEQIEAGIKYQPTGFKSYALVSIFDLTKQNVTQSNPAAAGALTQTGEIQVQGVEVEAVLDFDNGWRVLGAADFWNAEITNGIDPVTGQSTAGNRPARIPDTLARVWVDYTFRYGPFAGLGLGVGVRYFGDTFGDDANNYEVPDYTLVDAGIRYDWDQWRLSLNVNNVFDEEYIGTCGSVAFDPSIPSYDYCSYGKGRNATVRVGYRW